MNDDLHICKNHLTVMTYRGEKCPWCDFINGVAERLNQEYRRGFEDGVKAADAENEKQHVEVAKEAK